MHHAELIIGTLQNAMRVIPVSDTEANPDVRIIDVDRLGIDDARSLVTEAAQLPVREVSRTFIVSCREATLEAQNALLKTLEEPVETTRFYIVVPHEEVLIKTVRSRLLLHTGGAKLEEAVSAAALDFLRASYADRLTEIGKRAKEKDTDWMEDVIRALETAAEERKDEKLMRAVLLARNYFGGSGASKKMLLEHVALLA